MLSLNCVILFFSFSVFIGKCHPDPNKFTLSCGNEEIVISADKCLFRSAEIFVSLLDNVGCSSSSTYFQDNNDSFEIRFGLDQCGTLQSQEGNDLVFSNTLLAETEADDPFSPISFYTMTSIEITVCGDKK